jgi:hypothetical protein
LLPPRSRTTVHVNHLLGPGKDVSIAVEAEAPVVCERPMYFLYRGSWSGGHCVAGVNQASTSWYFAEGTTREGFDEWLCLQNPQGEEVAADLLFMTGEGENISHRVLLPPRSRTTVHVNHLLGPGKDVSIAVEAEAPVVCERPMYFQRWTVHR